MKILPIQRIQRIQRQDTNLSYELYRELASEICTPIDDKEMTLQLRFELYKSKLVYLYNVHEQCFRCINSNSQDKECDYKQEDFVNIQNAIEITKEFIKQTIRDAILLSIKSAETRVVK
ncbi:MAG: hypothetical protein V4591_01995 [Bdellovibrionota bacterium]